MSYRTFLAQNDSYIGDLRPQCMEMQSGVMDDLLYKRTEYDSSKMTEEIKNDLENILRIQIM